MGYRVIWTDEAIDDLRRAVAFIAKDKPAAAIELGEAIIRKSLLLAEHPRLGNGLPMDSKVFRPITITLPVVICLNHLKSSGRCHGIL